jgi:hypothetical protein
VTICDPKNIVAAVSLGHRGDSCFLPLDTPSTLTEIERRIVYSEQLTRDFFALGEQQAAGAIVVVCAWKQFFSKLCAASPPFKTATSHRS